MDFNELLKNIIPLLLKSFGGLGINTFGKDAALELSAELLNQLRRLLIIFAVTLTSLLLFLLGTHYIIIRILDQLDRSEFEMTNSIIFLLIFNSLCLAAIIYSTTRKTWNNTFAKKQDTTQASANSMPPMSPNLEPITSAVSLYILDIVKEREWKRAQQGTSDESTSQHQ